MLAIVDGRPRELSLKEMLQKFLEHRVTVIRRRTEYLLREAKRRGHILEGQLIAIADIENVIKICRTSPNRAEAKARLQGLAVPAALMERAIGQEAFASLQRELGVVAEYKMTEQQAEAVVRLQLGQLAALESDEILKEYTALREQIRGYEELLADEGKVRTVIRDDLERWRRSTATTAKRRFPATAADVDMEDLIDDEPNVVTVTHEGFIKRMPLTEYRVQGRGGKGVRGSREKRASSSTSSSLQPKAYSALLHQQGQMLLAEGVPDPAGEPHQPRPQHRERPVAAQDEKITEHRAGPRVRGGPVPH